MLRKIELIVISDVHLGTYGCHAEELAYYLESVDTQCLVLNGDIVDFWHLNWRYWPKSHTRVLEIIADMASRGVRIYYLTGNHDDVLRKVSDLTLGNCSILDKLVLNVGGKPCWFFHGDVFDSLVVEAKWLARLGSWGYDLLILLNRTFNRVMDWVGKPRFSLSKRVKMGVKKALLHVTHFENTIADLAGDHGYAMVACGHIHAPQIKTIHSQKHNVDVLYLNSGDWVENLTSLEFNGTDWNIFEFGRDFEFEKKIAVGDSSIPVETRELTTEA